MEETTNTENPSEVEIKSEPEPSSEFDKETSNEASKEKNVGMAIVAYILFFIPLLTDTKDDPFVKFHVKQGLLIFIGWVAVAFLSSLPFIMFFAWILNLGLLILVVIGIINAAGGKKTQLPFVGHWADKFTF